jgi:hypothetical protein
MAISLNMTAREAKGAVPELSDALLLSNMSPIIEYPGASNPSLPFRNVSQSNYAG